MSQDSDPLDGAHVLLTGATGFLGQAALERLLSAYPNTRISVLIRRRGSTTAQARFDALLRKPVFSTWRERVGADAVARAVAERVTVIEGDLGDGVTRLPADLDVVIHGASTVSFDPPIDDAFRVNVSGVVNLYEAVVASGSNPHVVHVSTAYVAGARKGVIPEEALKHSVDWRTELESALAARAEVERDSRRPEVLRRALARARAEHGKAGPQSTALAAEDARRAWVTERLVDYGRTRAQSLGWPDVYTFTKALGERVAEEFAASHGLRVSVVRPAIVESALRHPYPGWIDGFKMADPIILAFGRGILKEFPGLPDGVLDIIPVDIVINATLAVAAAPAEPAKPAYYHVGSGARNPLTFREMYEQVRAYFEAHPMPDGGRGQIKVPSWSFPGMRQVERLLRTGERAVDWAEKALLHLPATERTREWLTRIHRESQRLEFLRRYADLYGVYTEAEVIYTDSKLLALHQQLPPERVDEHGFDAAVIDWDHYLQEVHCPSVTGLMRQATGRGGSRTPALKLTRRTDPDSPPIVAVFDLEGTVIASNLIEGYLWARLADLPRADWPRELASLAAALPRYLRADHRDRGEFIRTFMRRYKGASEDELRRLVNARLSDVLLRRSFPEAVRRIRAHRAAGHRTILITGTADVLIEPLTPLFDHVVASKLHSRDGVLTGFLATPPLVGEARAAWLRRYAAQEGVDLTRSWAYGDSYSDRPLLEAVGNPAAVNPDPRLYQHAKRKHWRIETWGRHTGGALEALVEAVR